MAIEHVGYVELPAHKGPGGFDHAAVHRGRRQLYVGHTANDALDVIDCVTGQYAYSIPNLPAVAGALVSEERDLVFTSNRGENTIGIVSPGRETTPVKIPVGIKPNGLAYDPDRDLLLAANVGDSTQPGSCSVSIVDVKARRLVADIAVEGRTRWTVFDAEPARFYVNIADPPLITVIEARDLQRGPTFPVPAAGPHGLDLDVAGRRLFCACDDQVLVVLDARSGAVLSEHAISGAPDVVFFNPGLGHLYIAIGDPGVIDVFDTETMRRLETIHTEPGAHTIGFDSGRHTLYAFLPATHRASIFQDGPAVRGS